MQPIRVTFDTNVLPVDDLLGALAGKPFDFAVVSVTEREVQGSSIQAAIVPLGHIDETGVWDESCWDECVWDDEANPGCLEQALRIISNGSFPSVTNRNHLSDGQRRQLRDAMILCAHLREGRDILVSNDKRAFIREGRREELAKFFFIRIMTRDEFSSEFCIASSV